MQSMTPYNDIKALIHQKINIAWLNYWDYIPQFNQLKPLNDVQKMAHPSTLQ